jgi:hypothetical protein
MNDDWQCPICGREADDTLSEHHLIPKCKKGKETVTLHRVCHDFIHATFTDKELAHDYNTIEKLVADERVQKFGKWCSKRPTNFKSSSTLSNRTNRNKRKR